MAKCSASAFGKVRGKVGDLVFSIWKGKQVVRIYSTKFKDKPKLSDKAAKSKLTEKDIKPINTQIINALLRSLYFQIRPIIRKILERCH